MTGLLLHRVGVGSVASEAGFSPAALFAGGEAGAWYDPTDVSTLWADVNAITPATVGNAVKRIDDKSGNGNHITNAGGGPILRQSGGYYVEFQSFGPLSPVDNPLAGTTQAVAVYGHKINSGGSFALLNSFGTSGSNSHEPFGTDFYTDFGSTTRPNFGTLGAGTTNPCVMSLVRGPTNLAAYRDRTLIGSNATAVGWNATPNIGASFNCNCFQIVLVGRALSSEELTYLEDYVAAKAGVAL